MLTENEMARLRAEELFRYSVRKELARVRNTPRFWKWLNSAFGLWCLSTLLVGGAAFLYSEVGTNISARREQDRQIKRLDTEIGGRLRYFVQNRGWSIKDFNDALNTLEGAHTTYCVLPEYQSRGFSSLLYELSDLLPPIEQKEVQKAFDFSVRCTTEQPISDLSYEILKIIGWHSFEVQNVLNLPRWGNLFEHTPWKYSSTYEFAISPPNEWPPKKQSLLDEALRLGYADVVQLSPIAEANPQEIDIIRGHGGADDHIVGANEWKMRKWVVTTRKLEPSELGRWGIPETRLIQRSIADEIQYIQSLERGVSYEEWKPFVLEEVSWRSVGSDSNVNTMQIEERLELTLVEQKKVCKYVVDVRSGSSGIVWGVMREEPVVFNSRYVIPRDYLKLTENEARSLAK